MLTVTNLHKKYGAYHSVKGISFTAKENEVVALLGRNGAGKSTTMRMLAGYLAPTSGDIRLCGESICDNPRSAKRLIGYLPEIPPLYPYMTVTEQLRFVCDLRGIPARDVKRECERVCDMLSISHVSGRAIAHLSKGYRQRVGFAAALIGKPKLVILDEPTVGLDPQQVIEIRRLILNLSQEMTVLISSHILSEIASVCSHLLILRSGELVADGTAQEIADSYKSEATLMVSVRGDAALGETTLRACVGDRGTIAVQPGREETTFLVTIPRSLRLEEEVYRAFAPLCPQVLLTGLHMDKPSLESIFLDITSGQIATKTEGGENA